MMLNSMHLGFSEVASAEEDFSFTQRDFTSSPDLGHMPDNTGTLLSFSLICDTKWT